MATLDSISTDLVDDTEVISYSTNGDMATAAQDLLIGSTNKTSQGLWRKGVLVQIQGGVWSMETRLTADDLNMGVNQVPGFALLGKKRLLDAKYKNEFLNIIGKARSAAERLGFGFVLTGSYFVPFGNFDRLKAVIERQQETFDLKVNRFIEGYTERRAEYLEQYSEYWDKLDPYYPEPEYVRSKFSMQAIYYVASMSGTMTATGNSDDLYLKWVVDSMNGLRSEAREVASTIRKATSEGNLDGRTMRRVQTLIDRLQNMDMLEDPNLRNAALALAADASIGNAAALEAAATDVEVESVRAILLD